MGIFCWRRWWNIASTHSATLSLGDEPNDATESLKAMIMPVVRLLGDKELETLDVVGDLFSSLLLTYMNARKHSTVAVIDLNAKEGSTAS